ncbi:TerC family protein [Blattabacterium cuenoti]|uniref:TerC family protein n=1 Tax=Blattabacterium cuenoti TaxID=1653831 RepID=UPI00163C2BC2|nr:DUF475 domain-containing protein [Blattabacterium cuenoti]
MFLVKNLKEIIEHPLLSLSIIGNLILIESLLSIDNAAMLATMVKNLKEQDRNKAMRYGMIGAYFFRCVCLLFTSSLIKIWWLKTLGGLYLIFIGIKNLFFNGIKTNKFQKKYSFLQIIILLELVDLAFSIDNIFASVALSNNIILILLGSFIGIFSMRLMAKFITKLIDQYPELNHSVLFIIMVLGIKLVFTSFETHLFIFEKITKSKIIQEILFSLLIFFFFIFSILISWIKKVKK